MPQREDFDRYFAGAIIESATLTDELGSWLLRPPGGSYWCRITAAQGFITVVGDIGPMVFARGPLGPVECIAWIGSCLPTDTYYPHQKAEIGMRRRIPRGKQRPTLADVGICTAAIRELHRQLRESE